MADPPMRAAGAGTYGSSAPAAPTLGELARRSPSEESNNFLVLRLIAASLVIVGHAPAIAAPRPSYMDPFTRYLGYEYSGSVGLYIFFVISGFLVTASFERRRTLAAFAMARALRIYPGLIACVLLSALVLGPCFTDMPISNYLQSAYTWSYIGNVASLYGYTTALPGVTFSDRQWGIVVNGSLWSIFAEARLYMMVALFGTFGVLKRRTLANLAILALFGINLLIPGTLPFMVESHDTTMISLFFAAGALLYLNRFDVPMSGGALVLLALSCLLSRANDPLYQVFAGATLAYAVFYVAYLPKLRLPSFVQDFSFGIYLYGWPVKHVIAHFMPQLGPVDMIMLALPIAWAIGALSWLMVEKPALRLKSAQPPIRRAKQPEEPSLQASVQNP